MEVSKSITATAQDSKAPASESRSKTGIFKGILRKKAQIDSDKNPFLNRDDFDTNQANQAILDEIKSEKSLRDYQETQAYLKAREETATENFRLQTSVAELSAKHPEAGNIFNPQENIFTDDIFKSLLAKFDAHISETSGIIVDREGNPLSLDKDGRDEIKLFLMRRLEAWIKENPAEAIKARFNAYEEIEDTSGIYENNSLVTSLSSDSLVRFASSERRTVANFVPPGGPRRNAVRSSEKPLRLRREDDYNKITGRQNVVSIAYDMLTGDFDTSAEQNISTNKRYSNPERQILIHEVHVAQHRAAANLIVYGEA